MRSLFCFGFGFTAEVLAGKLVQKGWRITGTTRDENRRLALQSCGFSCIPFGSSAEVGAALASHDCILVSVPPDEAGDIVLAAYRHELLANKSSIGWIGYLSTTAVYGDRRGGWIDETSTPAPTTDRGRYRLAAETDWLALYAAHGLPVHVFRLAGIYGPGRNLLLALRAGKARRVIKEGQVFSRIHVEDIAGVLQASMHKPDPGRCYNVCDDEPAPPQDVVAFAAQISGLPLPPEIPFAEAALSGLSRSFYEESKRVSNRRIKEELSYRLLYPTYREGLRALGSAPC
jgi:nucleoside-diphosphate-sugar epimerase